VSHSYQTYFGFPGSDLNLDCGLRDHVITRFASTTPTPFHFHRSLPSTKRSSPLTLLHLTELNPSPSITVLSHHLQIPTDAVPLLSQLTHWPPSPGRHQQTSCRSPFFNWPPAPPPHTARPANPLPTKPAD
jgi:hypothetical protein